jgi:MipA family protein
MSLKPSNLAGAIVSGFVFVASQALAQAPSMPDPHAMAASGMALSGMALPDGVRVTVGAMATVSPAYGGSKIYHAGVLPIFKVAPLGAGGALGGLSNFDARAIDDISVAVIKHNGFEFGPLAGYRAGRAEKDSDRLHGLGDISGGLVAGAFAKYSLGSLFVRGSLHQHITGDDTGLIARLAAGSHFALTQRILIKAEASVDFADNAYMDAFFGVTPAQSARSGLRAFDPGSGPKSAGVFLGTEYALTPDWTLLAQASYARLLGDAGKSPVVESADHYVARLGASRAFDWRWR